MSKLLNKLAIITGGASGIGRQTVLEFVKEGATPVIVDINVEKGLELEAEIKANGSEALFVRTDITSEEEVKSLYAQVLESFGRVDILVNNAGILMLGATHEYDFAKWNKVVSINLNSVFLMTKEAINIMLKNGGGSVVSTASTAGVVGFEENAAYVATKHGVVGLTKALAVEYSGRGIRFNAVSPGDIETPMQAAFSADEQAALIADHPIGRLGKPSEIARSIVFLASDDASFVTGANLSVDGGFTAK